jgi:hypothetical protein
VKFFKGGLEQGAYDGRIVQFNNLPEHPAPPAIFLREHFKQAVLANMKGAGKVQFFDQDPSSDLQDMSMYEKGDEKEYFELLMGMKLRGHRTSNDNDFDISTSCPFIS